MPILLAALTVLAACRGDEPMPPEVSQILRQTVETQTLPASLKDQKEQVRAWEEMRRFYAARQFQPAWSDSRGPLPEARELLAAIDQLSAQGIDPRRYRKDELAALLPEKGWKDLADDPREQRRVADLDAQLTFTFLTIATHTAVGRLQPDTVRTDWYTKPRNLDVDGLLNRALQSQEEGAIQKALRGMTPPGEEYARLSQVLDRYQQIAEKGGWPSIPAGPELKPGDGGPRVAALRARLAAEGDLAANAAAGAAFDEPLAQAVSRFQRRNGLEVTGKVDEATLAALNVPAEDRLRQLVVNMERWRWMPSDLGERYIWVNIPEFRMDLFEGDRPAVSMRVVVGKEQSRTPVFSDKMEYLELNPFWNLPDSIINEEVLPALAKNPDYLASHEMEVVQGWEADAPAVSSYDPSQLGKPGSEYRLRQRPGAANPLGKVKFMFPNRFDIYLHDTPADHLFDRAERDFSHGCIRLERPIELAQYLLKDDPKWTPEAIQAKLASGETTSVPLPRPLAVHLVYFTAWADENGVVHFRDDVYGHDAKLAAALMEEPPVPLDLPAIRGDVRAAR
ncbi:MAG TPA: L,D-transpeptidase family protein [Thermoanaerobaculia bacterium]|nr:L,D-transpeptidase family protein [Thermoanaerobaculia bacterium]